MGAFDPAAGGPAREERDPDRFELDAPPPSPFVWLHKGFSAARIKLAMNPRRDLGSPGNGLIFTLR
ncbi:hypothetical protein GJ744_006186 [Endocarpon pusillum]|uniref:Uncharacterized protein n=1 Tax=Endocarpon pusillum TaxID=364733 RepID=A0A8H7AND4_9EURO|nr:hypothetical protein GJ744_006186 [Endocarpon pusillum]